MGFEGFPDGLGLLDEVAAGSKADFARLKPRWNQTIMEPVRALVDDLGEQLRSSVAPSIESQPKVNGSISPITRDLRFAKDKSRPYKDHLLLNFWDGSPKRTAPMLRVRIATDVVGFAAGAAFAASALENWRGALCSEAGPELIGLLHASSLAERELVFSEPELKRVPAGYTAEPAALTDLLRHKTFQARFLRPTPPETDSGAFGHWLGVELCRLGDVHNWLVTNTG